MGKNTKKYTHQEIEQFIAGLENEAEEAKHNTGPKATVRQLHAIREMANNLHGLEGDDELLAEIDAEDVLEGWAVPAKLEDLTIAEASDVIDWLKERG
jgi:hypothetical protein